MLENFYNVVMVQNFRLYLAKKQEHTVILMQIMWRNRLLKHGLFMLLFMLLMMLLLLSSFM
jgi:hypothetical protein